MHLGGLDLRGIVAGVKRALAGAFALSGDISPTQLAANTNDWDPIGLSSASVIRFSTDASRNVTGLQGGADGRIILLHNVGSQPAVLKREDANSTAANRFLIDADITLLADQSVLLWYDLTSNRWRQQRSSNGEYRSVQVFTATGTWTKPVGLKRVKVTVVGAGGGSGGVGATGVGQVGGSGGGGGGGAAIKTIQAATLGATETVTVGTGGIAGTSAPTSGGTGVTSSFGSQCSATGGQGGFADAIGAPPQVFGTDVGAGGGGSGSSGDINLVGGVGGTTICVSTIRGVSAAGGTSLLSAGGGARWLTAATIATVGQNYGGGAGGRATLESWPAAAGTAGADGIVIVEEFF